LAPALTESGASIFETRKRSAEAMALTVVDTDEVLFAGVGGS
jgi:hypothetical protein